MLAAGLEARTGDSDVESDTPGVGGVSDSEH